MSATPGTIARRRSITGPDHPEFQISKDEWNDTLVVVSDAVDGALLIRDRTQPDGWSFADALPAFLGVPPWRTINGHPLSADVVLTPADLGLGNVENVALSTWPGSTTLTTLGAITTGTWQGNIIQPQYGGTGSPYVRFTGPTAVRTYTVPDFDATLLTTASIIPPAQGGTGVTTGLTELNAVNLTMGIVPDARLSGNIGRTNIANNILWMAVDKTGSSLADLAVRSASDLNSGTLSVDRLPPDVVLGPLTASTLPPHHVSHERTGFDAIKLDDLALPDDNADLDSSVSRHGLLPRLSGQPTHRLDGTGLWTTAGVLPPYPEEPFMFLNGVGEWSYPPGSAPGAGTGNVIGPLTAVHQHIAIFSGTSGMAISDGGTTIVALHDLTVTDSVLAARADIVPVDLATEVVGILPPSNLPPTVQYKPVLVSDLPSHHQTHDTGGSDAIAALNAVVLTSGTLVDARLSANVPLLNAATNTFTGILVAQGGLGATPLNASNLLTGTLPLARLPLHSATHVSGGADAIKLDALAAPTDVTTLNASTTTHGLLLKLSGRTADVLSGTGVWMAFGSGIPSGTLAQQPTGLGLADAGLLYMVLAPYNHLCRWSGTVWEFAPGDCGNGFFTERAKVPQEVGWAVCNGGATDYLTVGAAALTVTTFTTPNLTTGVYLKGASTYTGTITGASVPSLVGGLAAAGAHGHTGATDAQGAHGHTGATDAQGGHAHTASTATAGAHTHPGSATDAQGSHGHTFTTNSVGNHNHTGETNALGDHSHGFGVHVLSGTESAGTMNADAGSSGAVSRGLHQHGVDFDGNTGTAGFHSHQVNLNPAGGHNHTGGTDAAGSHAHNLALVSDGNHAHGVTVDAIGAHAHNVSVTAVAAHAHNITATAVGDHTHSNGTLAVSGSGEPANMAVMVYFRR